MSKCDIFHESDFILEKLPGLDHTHCNTSLVMIAEPSVSDQLNTVQSKVCAKIYVFKLKCHKYSLFLPIMAPFMSDSLSISCIHIPLNLEEKHVTLTKY